MTTDDIFTAAVTVTKQSISRKHRIHSHSQSSGKTRSDDFRINRTLTATNRPSSKLPNVLTKASIYPLTPDPMHFKRCRPPQRDSLVSASPKLERQSTNINSQTRVPTLYSLTSDSDQRRTTEFRRRQIYALNHLMRELEQEQFQQFCKLNSVTTDNNNDDTNKQIPI